MEFAAAEDAVGVLASRSDIFSFPAGGLVSPEPVIICASVEAMAALPDAPDADEDDVVVVDGVAVTDTTGFWSTKVLNVSLAAGTSNMEDIDYKTSSSYTCRNCVEFFSEEIRPQ